MLHFVNYNGCESLDIAQTLAVTRAIRIYEELIHKDE